MGLRQPRLSMERRSPRRCLSDILAEAMAGRRPHAQRLWSVDLEAIIADVGGRGFRIFRHHYARRDVGTTILWAVDWYWQRGDVDLIAGEHNLLTWR